MIRQDSSFYAHPASHFHNAHPVRPQFFQERFPVARAEKGDVVRSLRVHHKTSRALSIDGLRMQNSRPGICRPCRADRKSFGVCKKGGKKSALKLYGPASQQKVFLAWQAIDRHIQRRGQRERQYDESERSAYKKRDCRVPFPLRRSQEVECANRCHNNCAKSDADGGDELKYVCKCSRRGEVFMKFCSTP